MWLKRRKCLLPEGRDIRDSRRKGNFGPHAGEKVRIILHREIKCSYLSRDEVTELVFGENDKRLVWVVSEGKVQPV